MIKLAIRFFTIRFFMTPLLAAFLAAGCSSDSKMPGVAAVGALSSGNQAAQEQGQGSSLSATISGPPASTGSIVPAKEES